LILDLEPSRTGNGLGGTNQSADCAPPLAIPNDGNGATNILLGSIGARYCAIINNRL
jgi:hypothetical protein